MSPVVNTLATNWLEISMPDANRVAGAGSAMLFHHVQMFVRSIKPLEEYKALEERLNSLANKGHFDPFSGGMRFLEVNAHQARVQEGKEIWEGTSGRANVHFDSAGQDIVEQLIVGLGWRITASYTGSRTRTVLVTSSDPCGVKLCITAESESEAETRSAEEDEPYNHFRAQFVRQFFDTHNDRQSIGVLAFEVPCGQLAGIQERYKKLHPKLLLHDEIIEYSDDRTIRESAEKARAISMGIMSVLEVYAYYQPGTLRQADTGTVLRFVERQGSFASSPGFANPEGVLPGLRDADPHFDGTSIPAYSDHWVSNVVDRVGFLETLEETLGFVPKVEFNAGVIAAGAARIESTVIGNSSAEAVATEAQVLKSQSQVYLPINNALSSHGHVHTFLEQFGQGVQHLASRVQDLISFVERVNNYRQMTGCGFRFLSIPRSYYGILAVSHLTQAQEKCTAGSCSGLPDEAAAATMKALRDADVLSPVGVVKLEVSSEEISDAVSAAAETLPPDMAELLCARMPQVIAAVRRARYINLYQLLGDNLEEPLYLQIVRNQVLVDIQAGDVLLQIFTCKILQEEGWHEAPFLEFIQRVCSQCRDGACSSVEGAPVKPIKPGCGGFGIRNFLTLFLSIELSKALADREDALVRGDEVAGAKALRRSQLLNQQLDESNPILTAIADTMASEARALEEGDEDEAGAMQRLKAQLTHDLQVLSDRYSTLTSEAS